MGDKIILSINGVVESHFVSVIPPVVGEVCPCYPYTTVIPVSVEILGKIVEEKGKWKRRICDILSLSYIGTKRKYQVEPMHSDERKELESYVKRITGVSDVEFCGDSKLYTYTPMNLYIKPAKFEEKPKRTRTVMKLIKL